MGLAKAPDANISQLCRRYAISRKTGYKWLGRGLEDLADRSRRPLHSPRRTAALVEAQVGALQREHPAWGGRKISRRLADLGMDAVPHPSTVSHILERQGLLGSSGQAAKPWQRFEHAAPNDLWQMDFKGHFQTAQGKCHALTVLQISPGFFACGFSHHHI